MTPSTPEPLTAAEQAAAEALQRENLDGAFDPAADDIDEGISLAARAVVARVRGPLFRESAARISTVVNRDRGELARAHGPQFVTGLMFATTLIYRIAHQIERDGIEPETPAYVAELVPCSECAARQAGEGQANG